MGFLDAGALTMAIRGLIDWRKGWNDPDNIRVSYEGAVLQTYEHNGYDDSDFYAIVWDDAAGEVREVCYGSTRHAGGDAVTVDATDEVRAKARRVLFEERVALMVEQSKIAARVPDFGKVVAVTATKAGKDRRLGGQVVPAGSTGTVTWKGPDRHRRDATRYGVTLESGERVFGGLDVFEVVDPGQYEITETEVRGRYSPEGITSFYRPRAGVVNMMG